MHSITRTDIINLLSLTLEPMEEVYALWEGGAAANNRLDQWSDIDLMIDVEDNAVEKTVNQVEKALLSLSPFKLQYVLPAPTWHGHYQSFILLADTSPFLMIDYCVIQHSNPNKFTEPEIHGCALVHFDKLDVVATPPQNPIEWEKKLHKRLETLKINFDLFQPLVEKEIHRRHLLDCFSFYQGMTIRPLVEVLRIKYDPYHHNFHTRYANDVFPRPVLNQLEELIYVTSLEDIAAKMLKAKALFETTWNELTQSSSLMK